MKLSITISDLENLLASAKKGLSDQTNKCIDIEIISKTDIHGGSDKVTASIQSGWAECVGKKIYNN